jgi:uncharacterized RDD family membrane protein YckC
LTRPDFHGEAAGVVTRALAALIDMLVVVVLLVVVWASYAAIVFLARPARFAVPSPSWSEVVWAGSVASVLYLSTAWATTGRTVGAQVLGLRVLDQRGRQLGWWRSVVRAVAYVVFPLGLAWAIVDRRSRSVQDVVLASSVVYDWVPRVPIAHFG